MNFARFLALPLAGAALLAAASPAAAGPYITSRVLNYGGPPDHCVHAGRRTLEFRRIGIDNMTATEVFGTTPGITVGIRCEPGIIFIYASFVDNAPRSERQRLMDDLRSELARNLGGPGGGGGRW